MNKAYFFMHTLYSNSDVSKSCTSFHYKGQITERIVCFHHWHWLELVFPVTRRSTVPQHWKVVLKSWRRAAAWRADSEWGEGTGRVFGNSKDRTVNFPHTAGQSLNDSSHTSMQGRGITGDSRGPMKKLESAIFEQWLSLIAPEPPTRDEGDSCKPEEQYLW